MSKIKRSKDEKIFDFINYSLLAIFGIMFIYPIIYVFSASVTKPYLLEIGEMYLLPKGISMASFKAAMSLDGIWLAYANSIFITVVGTAVSMFFTITGAYVLSKPELKFRKILTLMVVVTMWFDPGM
ncbi:MAG: carbohydrate ABC transporter permease, partial [Cetobacterium sp.]